MRKKIKKIKVLIVMKTKNIILPTEQVITVCRKEEQ